jgi:hypothetical protein
MEIIKVGLLGILLIAIIKWAEHEYENYQKRKLKSKSGSFKSIGEAGKSLETARIPIRAENRSKGIIGEHGVGAELDRIAKEYGLTVLHDLSIPKSKANIDHLLISSSAIFLVDAKNYAGVIRTSNDKDGNKKLYVGKYVQTSMLIKLNKYAQTLRKFLESEGLEVRVVPMLAFYNATFKDGMDFHLDGIAINAGGIELEVLKYANSKGPEIDVSEVTNRIRREFPPKA